MKRRFCTLIAAGLLSGCASTPISPSATLLAGLTQYQGDMQRVGASASRWPERQRAGGSLKTVVAATVGGSAEFNRLIDLDLRKRDFVATLRETSVRPERAKEMAEEIAQMNDEIAALKPVIRTQLAALQFAIDPERRVEEAAARGLISLALDGFSSNGNPRRSEAASTSVGPFLVTDMGSFATVRGPDGRSFRCHVFGAIEDGAGMKCEELR